MNELKTVQIHPSAIVEKGAELGAGVKVGPFAVIGASVVLHDGVEIGAHAMVSGRTHIGAKTRVWPFAHIGTTPQDLKYAGEDSLLVCGENNMFREYVNISIGTDGGAGKTVIGSGNLFMVNTHIAHDCIVGNDCIIANGVSLAGHVELDDGAVIGGHVAIHQFVKIGELAMLAGGSIVVQDVPPFVTVQGDRAKPTGINKLGLKRAGYMSKNIDVVKEIYKTIFHSNLTLDEAKSQIEENFSQWQEAQKFLQFLQRSQRGLCR